jgi:autotransporter translocation and assembly factor TamB
VSTEPGVIVSIVFNLGLYLQTLELLFLLFLSGIVSTEPGVMVSIVFTWDCIYTPGVQSQIKTIETITSGCVDTLPCKNNRNHNSRLCRYNPR